MWNVARTQADIMATMGTKLVGNEDGLVGYWKFDDGTGTTAKDSVTTAGHTAHDGTLMATDPSMVPDLDRLHRSLPAGRGGAAHAAGGAARLAAGQRRGARAPKQDRRDGEQRLHGGTIPSHGQRIGAVESIQVGTIDGSVAISVPSCAVWPAVVTESLAVVPVPSSNFQYPTRPSSLPTSFVPMVAMMSACERAMFHMRNSSIAPLK